MFKNLVIYILGEGANKLFPFFMLPILTSYLSPEDFGYYATVIGISTLFVVLIGASQHACISRFFYFRDTESYGRLFHTAVFTSVIMFTFWALIIFIFSDFIEKILGLSLFWQEISLFLSLFQVLSGFVQVYFQINKRAKDYVIFQVLITLISFLCTLYFVIFLEMAWQGYVLGTLSGSAIITIIFILNNYTSGVARFKLATKYEFIETSQYSLPLIPHNLSTWCKTNADKLLLASFYAPAIVGSYFINGRIAAMLGIGFTVVNRVLQPFYYECLKLADSESWGRLKRIFVGHIVFTFLSVFFFYLIHPYLFSILIKGDHKTDEIVFTSFILMYLFQGLYFTISNFVFFYGNNILILKASVLSSIVYIVLIFFAVQYMGYEGVAIANAVSMGLLFSSVLFLGNKAKVFKNRNQ